MQHGPLSQEIRQRVGWLRGQLLCWFEHHGRSFPWREPGRSTYGLTVAEILLQRTTAAGVARAFSGLIARYPTWEVMARTSLEEFQVWLRPLGLWRQKARLVQKFGAYCWFVATAFADGSIGHLDLTMAVRIDWHEGFQVYREYGCVLGKTFNPWYLRSSEVECFSVRDGQYHRRFCQN